jgi:nicotinamide phosphoribosyltransferase
VLCIDNKVVFVGLQGFIKEFLIEAWDAHFFARPKANVVAEYKRRCDNFLGPDAVRTDHIAALHDLGYLPIVIKALPEGSRVDIKVPFLTIRNTLPQFYWLTNYLETVLSDELWQQITVATITYEYRRILNKYVELTGSRQGLR